MVPYKDGKANHGHSCVKGRFAYGYATHRDRILKPMIRAKVSDPWREVSWDEAFAYAASELKRIQAKYGKHAIGGITSSRCTNEETYLIQKLVRAVSRGHSRSVNGRPWRRYQHCCCQNTAFGTSAGTQDFDSVDETDVEMIIGANPTDAHPVFASQMKKRLREAPSLLFSIPAVSTLFGHRMSRPTISFPCSLVNEASCGNAAILRNSGIGRNLSLRSATARKRLKRSQAFRPISSARRRGSMPPAAMRRSIMGSALPSTARARPRCSRSPISRSRPETLAVAASASIRCAARTIARGLRHGFLPA